MLDLNGGNYFGLDAFSGSVWDHLCAGRTPAETVRILAPQYDVSEPVMLADVLRFVTDLAERGLVEINDSTKESVG